MTNQLGLLIRSPIMPEESFPFYLARIGRYASKGRLPRAWLWPSGLGPLADELERFVGSRATVRARNSLIPFVSRTLKQEHQEMVERHFFDQSTQGLMAVLGLAGPGTGWARMTPARCPNCIIEDIAPCNKPFWRREHLIPGVLMCSRHKSPLHVTCDGCVDFSCLSGVAVHPAAHCGCGLRPLREVSRLTDADMEMETELARISARLLNSDYMPTFRRERITHEIMRATRTQGLVKNYAVQWELALDFFRNSRCSRLLERVNVPIARTSQLRQVLVGNKILRNPLQCIALLMSLNGSWDAVERAFSRQDAEEIPYPVAREKAESTTRTKRLECQRRWREKHHARWFEHYRAMYRRLRTANPEMTHVQLMRQMPHNAVLFISRESLAAAGEDVSLFGFGKTYYEELDESMSRHVNARASMLKQDGIARRLTARVLLRGHRMDRGWSGIRDQMPLTRMALDEHVETVEQYRARHPRPVPRSSTRTS